MAILLSGKKVWITPAGPAGTASLAIFSASDVPRRGKRFKQERIV
ncbi:MULTISPECIES: hypothetical protein [Paraburkholderia]|nr:hypothetical protein [Paraburkholderia fungorum]